MRFLKGLAIFIYAVVTYPLYLIWCAFVLVIFAICFLFFWIKER